MFFTHRVLPSLTLALALAGPATAADPAVYSGRLAGFPGEIHLPAKYELRWIQQMTTNRLDSTETPDMLADECNKAMKAAGWSGTIVSHAPAPSSGSFNKGARFARVTVAPTPNSGGSSMDVETNGKLGPGETLAAHGDLPGDVCRPASTQLHPGFSGQQNTMVVMHTDMSQSEMAAEFRQAMSGIGWEQTENNDMGPMLHMIFVKPGTQHSVAYAIKPGHGGTGSEVVVVVNDVRH